MTKDSVRSSLVQTCSHAPFGVILLNTKGKIRFINEQALENFNLSQENEVIGQPVLDYISESEKKTFSDLMQTLGSHSAEPGGGIFQLSHPENGQKKFIFYGRAFEPSNEVEGQLAFYLFPIEKTENILKYANMPQASQGQSGSPIQYQTIFEYASMGFAIINEELIFFDMNQVFADFFNVKREEIRGKHYSHVFKGHALEKFESLLKHVTHGNHGYSKDIFNTHTVGGHKRVLEFSLTRMFKEYPGNNLMLLMVEDITSQQDTRKALIQSEKLALTGRLAASLAHEINNPLQTSIGCLGLAEEMLGEDDKELGIYIQMAIDELQRSARIVKRLRDLNHNAQEGEKSPIDLVKLLDGVLLLTKKRLSDRNISVDFPYLGEKQLVNASSDQIQQVFLNVILNAIDALPNGGRIYIDIVETDYPRGVEVNVRDTGEGIRPETLEHLFDPFFTTKDDGLGLGLFISKKIIDDHKGEMNVESQPGSGTEISIWLPIITVEKEEGANG